MYPFAGSDKFENESMHSRNLVLLLATDGKGVIELDVDVNL